MEDVRCAVQRAECGVLPDAKSAVIDLVAVNVWAIGANRVAAPVHQAWKSCCHRPMTRVQMANDDWPNVYHTHMSGKYPLGIYRVSSEHPETGCPAGTPSEITSNG